jgi:chromosome partitioning protein
MQTPSMTAVSVCNHKGGTGKTTTAIHVAAALGLSGVDTLVIDLDPQGFLSRTLDVNDVDDAESVAAFFDPELDVSSIPIRRRGGFDLIPASNTLTKRMRSLNKPTDVLWVRETLGQLSSDYDVLLFDTAAAVTVYSLNALVASQHVLIPVLPEYQGIVGAEQTFQTAGLIRDRLNPSLAARDFVFTQVDARKRIHETYQRYMRQKYEDRVLDNVVRTSTSLAQAHQEGATVFDHDPHGRGARDYANVTDEYVNRLKARNASGYQSGRGDAGQSGASTGMQGAADASDRRRSAPVGSGPSPNGSSTHR